jgi:hypothetical protein
MNRRVQLDSFDSDRSKHRNGYKDIGRRKKEEDSIEGSIYSSSDSEIHSEDVINNKNKNNNFTANNRKLPLKDGDTTHKVNNYADTKIESRTEMDSRYENLDLYKPQEIPNDIVIIEF